MRPISLLVTAAYVGLVCWLTLGTVSNHGIGYEVPGGVLNPATWIREATWNVGPPSEIVANILLFVPVGVLFAVVFGRRLWWLALLAAAALTVTIEILQIPMPDRISDPRDLVANSAGALIGIAIVSVGWLATAVGRALSRSGSRLSPEP